MTIVGALKNKENDLRLTNRHRWLVWSNSEQWVVYERKPYARFTTRLISTDSESEAVEVLLAD